MGDPLKKVKEAPLPQTATTEEPTAAQQASPEHQQPMDAGAVENAAVAANQAMTLNRPRKGAPTVVIPGGQRRDATPLMNARYTLNQHTKFLGEPETILTDDWKRDHQGWKYEWPIGDSNETRAYLRSGWFHAVPPDALREDNPHAIVGDAITPKGTAIAWMRHILVAVPPEVYRRRHTEPAEYALARTASSGESDEATLNARFGEGGFRAEVEQYSERE